MKARVGRKSLTDVEQNRRTSQVRIIASDSFLAALPEGPHPTPIELGS